MGLNRTAEVTLLSSVFYQYRNTISVYTEDNDKDKKFYVTLLNRLLLGTGVVINDIFPLGDCDVVYRTCQRDTSPNPKLYIIDGDIFQMITPKTPINHLYILPAYCIENFVLDKSSFYRVFDELDYLHESDEIHAIVDYDTMIQEMINPFMDLFRHFAVSREHIGIFRLKDSSQFVDRNANLCQVKIDEEKQCIRNDLLNSGTITETDIEDAITIKEGKYADTEDNLMKYVSGKDYLLPYVCSHANNLLHLNLGLRKENWKYQFSKYCDLTRLSELKAQILREVAIAVDVS